MKKRVHKNQIVITTLAVLIAVLEKPWEYVESKTYFSWERFFTAVLIEETNGSYLAYAKRKLNPAYLNDFVKDSILEQMTKIQLF